MSEPACGNLKIVLKGKSDHEAVKTETTCLTPSYVGEKNMIGVVAT